MRHVFRLPDVGEGIASAEIVEYLVKPGDKVKADQPVVRIETDKAVVELPSPVAGTVVELPLKPGDTANVGDPLLIVEVEGAPEAEAAPGAAKPTPQPEKPAAEAPAVEAPPRREEKPAPQKPQAAPAAPEASVRVLATPHTRRVARELKVDIATVKGSGPHGRITDEDVKRAAAQTPPTAPKAPTAAAVQAPATAGFDFEKYGPTRREPFKGVRKRIAEVMVRSVSTIPHVTHFDEADVTDLINVVEKERPLAESRGIKLTVLAFLTKAAASGLRTFPVMSSSIDEETGELVFKEYVHIGIATDTEAGLMVPVIRDVDRKSVLQIAGEIQALTAKAKDRSIDIEELRGGSFTITNVGAIGGQWATPIILHPQVAILCSLRATEKPVVREGEIVIRTIMPLTLSFDHRVLDGATAGRFANYVKALLEDPMRMLVDMV
jgi:pyruvate dehydrogenase E2 component (dihydrolipoamide acetyltransferase)